jgi:hypothetical protein
MHPACKSARSARIRSPRKPSNSFLVRERTSYHSSWWLITTAKLERIAALGFDLGPHDPGSPVALLDRQVREPSPGLSSKVAALRRRLIEMSTFRAYQYEGTTIIVMMAQDLTKRGTLGPGSAGAV